VDDFSEKSHTLSELERDIWAIYSDGSREFIKFGGFASDPSLSCLIKGWAAYLLSVKSPGTSRLFVDGVAKFDLSDIVACLESAPQESRWVWDTLRAKEKSSSAFVGLKSLLKFAAENRVGSWTPLNLPFISASLPLPPVADKFAAIRRGDVFISIEEEALLVRWIDNCCAEIDSLSDEAITDVGLVICNYQFAMRPKQIGLLRRRDCRVANNVTEGTLSVYLTFRMIKQKRRASKPPLIRKVKREWAPIFVRLFQRHVHESGDAHLFGHTSSSSISTRLITLLCDILKRPRSSNDLRHSGAMRMVDAGAVAEELAEFMGQSSLESGLVYYATSATQAERVNTALGLSETYQRVAKLGRERFITEEELSSLKEDQQIAGVPHGIPIAGIGGCKTGQPNCPYNPVTACYGCHKFMPVSDLVIHKQVLSDFRGIVIFFFDASRGEAESPAYQQLRQTIIEVKSVIDELEAPDA
jgi:integrase